MAWFPTLYLRVGVNHVHARNITKNIDASVTPEKPFTTQRVLVGNFLEAELAIRKAIFQVYPRNIWLRPPPYIVVHPLALTEGGLSPVERRALIEVCMAAGGGSGARTVTVHVGAELTDSEVENLIRAK